MARLNAFLGLRPACGSTRVSALGSLCVFFESSKAAAASRFWTQDFSQMFQLADPNNISAVVKAGYRGIQLPTHISPAKHFYFISDWVRDQTRDSACLS